MQNRMTQTAKQDDPILVDFSIKQLGAGDLIGKMHLGWSSIVFSQPERIQSLPKLSNKNNKFIAILCYVFSIWQIYSTSYLSNKTNV